MHDGMRWRRALGVWLLAGSALLPAAHADELHYNLISLTGEAREEVPNDWMRAVLALEVRDRDPARLGQALNRRVEQALAKSRAFAEVRLQSQGYQTFPETDEKGKFVAWRGQAQIAAESADFDRLGKLIGELQADGLVVQGIDFMVSPKRRQEVEDALTKSAIGAFRQRARLAQQALDAPGFRVVELQIDGGPEGMPYRPVMRMMSAAKQDAVPLETRSGTTALVVRVSGRVQLDP
ncbi:MAG TPA: SIMPL domain-containing protein [Candidatus Macondimonas sp.]|nr:SIMPL domain-containing protein [Candidatus Macondimonas sp.]